MAGIIRQIKLGIANELENLGVDSVGDIVGVST